MMVLVALMTVYGIMFVNTTIGYTITITTTATYTGIIIISMQLLSLSQGCALVVPGCPRRLTFAFGNFKGLEILAPEYFS